jgi:hypothetical protein
MVRRGTAGQGAASLLRELFVGLLVALFLLSSIAALRAKSAFNGLDHAFALCRSGEAGGNQPADHDCDSCRLGHGPLLAAPLGESFAPASPDRRQPAIKAAPIDAPTGHGLPWSRGPPGVA